VKIVILRKVSENTKQLISRQFPRNCQIVIVPPAELKNEIEDAAVLIPENSLVESQLLDKAKNLKLIQCGAGYDNVPIEECTNRGIWVANAAGINARAVAEHVYGFILTWFKNIITLNTGLKTGKNAINYEGAELSEKTIGIIGLGHIGKEVARLATAFHMKVFGYHYRTIEIDMDIEITDFQTLLKHSDIITLHVSLNHDTHHLIGREEFELMKKDAFVINTSRGSVLEESALIEALQEEKIAGAGLDVFEKEPLADNSPLRKLDNVILTPHMAGEPDALYFHAKRFKFFAENIRQMAQGKIPQKTLNQL
jgi:D-3-phosphoglycerate dehydrogenase